MKTTKFIGNFLSFFGFKIQTYQTPVTDDVDGEWAVSDYEITHKSKLLVKVAAYFFVFTGYRNGYKEIQIERNTIFVHL